MTLDGTFLRSKLGRRILVLFTGCALLPVGVLALLAFTTVRTQLSDQHFRRLREASKTTGLAIYERLLFLEADLERVGTMVQRHPGNLPVLPPGSFRGDLGRRYVGLALFTGRERHTLLGQGIGWGADGFADRQVEHMRSGKTIVFAGPSGGGPVGILLGRAARARAGPGVSAGRGQPDVPVGGRRSEGARGTNGAVCGGPRPPRPVLHAAPVRGDAEPRAAPARGGRRGGARMGDGRSRLSRRVLVDPPGVPIRGPALDLDRIIRTVLMRAGEPFGCNLVGLTIRDAPGASEARTYTRGGDPAVAHRIHHTTLTTTDMERLQANPDGFVLAAGEAVPEYLRPAVGCGRASCLVLPLSVRDHVAGVLALAADHGSPPAGEDRIQARQLADRMAVALSNAYEIAERRRAEASLAESHRRLEQTLADLRAAQEQALQHERLRALGQMASGIAHDFNNALSPIVGLSDLLLNVPGRLDDQDKARRYLERIRMAALDAANVVRRLREFYRPREDGGSIGSVDVKALVGQAVLLTQPRWKQQAMAKGLTISVATDLTEVPRVAGNEAELRELLINLIFNAVDAMPAGGTITLRSRRDDGAVRLEVSDTGIGMTEEVRVRCLEPFFSTKGERGTGLGLAMVYGIVQRHAGTLNIESEPGKGTTFTIRLPVPRGEVDAAHAEVCAGASRPLRVLVVEDEPAVREVLREYLMAEGHTVETGSSGRLGLERFRAQEFDLVMMDWAMPDGSGDRLAVAIKQLAPRMPVVLVTGFGDLLLAGTERPPGVDLIVSKPVTLQALRQAVTTVMAGRESPSELRAIGGRSAAQGMLVR